MLDSRNAMTDLFLENQEISTSDHFDEKSDVVFLRGDSLKSLKTVPDESIKLIITSPPYNLEKEYEEKR